MSCAEFESRLAEVLAGEPAETSRDEALQALRAHAEGCPDCGGCLDLIDLAQRPSGERDLVDTSPPAEYWTTFNERVRGRIEQSRDAPAPRRRVAWAAAAAVLLVAAAGVWLYSGAPWNAGDPSSTERPSIAQQDLPAAGPTLPDPLDDLLSRVSPEQALAELELLGGIDEPWAGDWRGDDSAADPDVSPESGAWLFPDTNALDEDASKRLLEWLREQNATEKRVRS